MKKIKQPKDEKMIYTTIRLLKTTKQQLDSLNYKNPDVAIQKLFEQINNEVQQNGKEKTTSHEHKLASNHEHKLASKKGNRKSRS